MSTTINVRNPVLHVYVDGREVFGTDATRLQARWALGYDMQCGEATITCPFTPPWAHFLSTVTIVAGASEATAAPRWSGFLVEFDTTAYPLSVDLVCRGPLYLATVNYPDTPDALDLSNGGAGQTDQAIVTYLLGQAGLSAYLGDIGGTGKTLGTVSTDYNWPAGQSALDAIKRIDEISLGWCTFESPAGRVVRRQITASPAAFPAATFTEGVDIFGDTTSQSSILSIANKVVVTGFTPAGATDPYNYSLQQANPNLSGTVPLSVSSTLIESSTTGGTGISAQEVATWQLPEVNRGIVTPVISTPRDDLIGPGATVAVDAMGRVGVNQNLWVQRVEGRVDPDGAFTQVFHCLGIAVGSGGVGTTTGGTTGGGQGGGGSSGGGGGGSGSGGSGGGSGGPPGTVPPQVDFTITVEQERVIVAGVAQTLYVVSCAAAVTAGSAAISTYAWTTSGGSPTVASGSNPDFTTAYAAISSQTITLTVTDADGGTGAMTHTIPAAAAAGYLRRRLFLAGTSCIDDFDGASWRTAADAGLLVANGPIWGVGTDVYTSPDDLASTPTHDTPFLSGNVSALWFEGDYNTQIITAGSTNGAVAVSFDSGLTWTIFNAAPSAGHSVLRVVKSRYVSGQYFALTDNGLWRTDNSGSGWVRLVAAAGGETFRDMSVSFARIMVAMSGGRLVCDQAGTAQTLPTNSGDIIAITADIKRDRFYAYDSAGNTFYHTADGGTTMGARTALPASGAVRGLWRDSHIPGLLYIAAGAAYKSVDGFGSSGGYFIIREAGVDGAPGGASYVQIGTDGNLTRVEIPAIAKTSKVGAGKIITLWNGSSNNPVPFGWEQPGFNDTSWNAVVAANITGYSPVVPDSADYIWAEFNSLHQYEQVLYRVPWNIPAGNISTADFFWDVNDQLVGFWVNGRFVYGFPGIWPTVDSQGVGGLGHITFPPSLLLAGQTNTLAFYLANNSPLGGSGGAWFGFSVEIS